MSDPGVITRSLWLDRRGDGPGRRPALPGDRQFDVTIVGAGFTGLWTALYLARNDPGLRIAVVDKNFAGFGASGRNGGWCSALFPASWGKIARRHGRNGALALKAAMRGSIDEIEKVTVAGHLDCDFTRGGTLGFVRSTAELTRARAEIVDARNWGDSEADQHLVGPADLAESTGVHGVLGATFTPHCAVLDPAALVHGLADLIEAAGVHLYEDTAALSLGPGMVTTDRGRIRTGVVVRATEAYTATLPGERRAVAPVYSLIVATEPLPPEISDAVGLVSRPSFTDHRHLICYGQRTADGRLVFGGRGAPYHFASRIRPDFDREPAVFQALRRNLLELFPMLTGVGFTHAWGGPLGISRNWTAGVRFDRKTGMASAGGYVGDGVATSNLAGRTLADLITGVHSDLVELPWVDQHAPRWEPEPLRYLGINGSLRLAAAADRAEARTGRPSRRARLLGAPGG